MLNVEITELLKYLKDIAANEKADDVVWKNFVVTRILLNLTG